LGLSEEAISRAILGALVLLGLLLRIYNLSPIAWVPDHYDRLIEVQAMLDGKLPASHIYTPGFSLVLLLPSAIFGVSISTIQGVTVAFGLALIPLVYLLSMQATANRPAALLAAGLTACSPLLVYTDRAASIDSLVTFLGVLSIYAVPRLKAASLRNGGAIGGLLALLFLLRASSAVLIPPLVVYWVLFNCGRFNAHAFRKCAISPLWLSAGTVFIVVASLATFPSNWFGADPGSSSGEFLGNLSRYWFLLSGHVLAPIFLPFALAGLHALSRVNKAFAVTLVLVLTMWTVAHSPFSFAAARYMGIGYVLAYLTVGLAFANILAAGSTVRMHGIIRPGTWISAPVLFLLFLIGSGTFVANSQSQSDSSDYGMSHEIAPRLQMLDERSLIVTSTARAFELDAFPQEFIDLIDISLDINDRKEGASAMSSRVTRALQGGRSVYYVYSHLEAEPGKIGGAFAAYDIYFQELDNRFKVTEVFRTKSKREDRHPWVLYEISDGR